MSRRNAGNVSASFIVLLITCNAVLGSPECKADAMGFEFMGTVSHTVSGKPCQMWTSQYPHGHKFKTGDMFPDQNIHGVVNYCRNPDRAPGGPWCYTTDRNVRWEYCDVPLCQKGEGCKDTRAGTKYMGTVAVTKNGKPCQTWSSQHPHKHRFKTGNMFPDQNMDNVANYCRNPDRVPEGPWCYTNDPSIRWEFCDVPLCQKNGGCKDTIHGTEYMGTLAMTRYGKQCQMWSSQHPHKHRFKFGNMFPDRSMDDVVNYCRNPDHVAGGPWCYTTDRNVRWEFCDVPLCQIDQDCKLTTLGQEYRGKVAVTRTGKDCQAWSAQSPHKHSLTTPTYFPDTSVAEMSNFCRNPDAGPEGVWCYTTDRYTRWEYCDVPQCPCRSTVLGREFKGNIAITKSGKTCQSWSSQEPHNHTFQSADSFPDESMVDVANYCRNPNKDVGGPWCYTTDTNVRYEHCNIPQCEDCLQTERGQEYQGAVSVTETGKRCQTWTSQYPHKHPFTVASIFPDDSMSEVANHCRNPDNSRGPWCHTTDPNVVWEYCSLPQCLSCKKSTLGREYKGTKNETESGIECQRWDSQYPHKHRFTTAEQFLDNTMKELSNYCRNSDGRENGPWCYTVDPDKRWEYCDVPLCGD